MVSSIIPLLVNAFTLSSADVAIYSCIHVRQFVVLRVLGLIACFMQTTTLLTKRTVVILLRYMLLSTHKHGCMHVHSPIHVSFLCLSSVPYYMLLWF